VVFAQRDEVCQGKAHPRCSLGCNVSHPWVGEG